jgi:biopolymer transport protein ExbD
MRFLRTVQVGTKIPAASMANMIFLLFVFFMATTIFNLEEGLQVTLPRAEMGERVPRERITHIWIDASGRVSVDNQVVAMEALVPILDAKVRENPELVVGFNCDQEAEYALVAKAIDAVKAAGVLPVSFTTRRPEE